MQLKERTVLYYSDKIFVTGASIYCVRKISRKIISNTLLPTRMSAYQRSRQETIVFRKTSRTYRMDDPYRELVVSNI